MRPLARSRVEKDTSVQQRAVQVGHERADVPERARLGQMRDVLRHLVRVRLGFGFGFGLGLGLGLELGLG